MVLARRIGHRRPYPLVLLLYVATFGIYGIYWHYKAHHEVYRQFELDLESRQEGLVWLILDRVFFPLRWIYQYGFVGNVGHVRRRMGAEHSLTPATFLGLTIPGTVLMYGALVLAIVASSFTNEAGQPTSDWFGILLGAAGASIIIGAALLIPAYALLQRDLNGLWDAYDRRLVDLLPPVRSPQAIGWRSVQETGGPSQVPPGMPPSSPPG